MRNLLVLIFSSIVVCFAWADEAYEATRLRSDNPQIVSRFAFLKAISLDKPVTIAILGDFPHVEEFQDLIAVNAGEIPENGIDDDGNGFIDDYHGMDFHVGHGRTNKPVITGHENSIISLIDFLSREHDLIGKIKVIPVNITSHALSFDELYVKKMADAVDYARVRGADVISMSFGVSSDSRAFFNFIEGDLAKSQAYLQAALNRADQNNILMVGAVSNNPGRDHVLEPVAPANSSKVISVANVNFSAVLQSAYGKNVDLAFYGTDLAVWGGHKEGYKRVKGSSYSTPLVAFTLAIAKSLRPDLSLQSLKAMKQACERRISSKKSVSSGCVFSPEKFILQMK